MIRKVSDERPSIPGCFVAKIGHTVDLPVKELPVHPSFAAKRCPRLLPTGNPFKCHEDVLSSQPEKNVVLNTAPIVIRFDGTNILY